MGIQPDARFPARSADAFPRLCMGISPMRYTEIGLFPDGIHIVLHDFLWQLNPSIFE
jgi:hypothetical protein